MTALGDMTMEEAAAAVEARKPRRNVHRRVFSGANGVVERATSGNASADYAAKTPPGADGFGAEWKSEAAGTACGTLGRPAGYIGKR